MAALQENLAPCHSNSHENMYDYRHSSYRSGSNVPSQSHTTTALTRGTQPSMLVDLTAPRPIPVRVALRMVQTSIQLIMYLRGLTGSPWDQLTHMLQLEVSQREESGATAGLSSRWTKNSKRQSISDLQKFLETGEGMFHDLREAIYKQTNNSSRSSSQPLNIIVAMIFGQSASSPKEQYMIQIGPLEPQHPRSIITSPSDTATSSPARPLSEISFPTQTAESNAHQQQQHKLRREEQLWERKLIQEIMGMTLLPTDPEPPESLPSEDSAQITNRIDLAAELSRTKVHLLLKSEAGQSFQGLIPKQMLMVQEDNFSISSPLDNLTLPKRRWPIHHIHVKGSQECRIEHDSSHSPNLLDSGGVERKEIWYQVGQGIPVLSSEF